MQLSNFETAMEAQVNKPVRLCLIATKKQIDRIRKLPEIAGLPAERQNKKMAEKHEAAIDEASEVLRAAGMDGVVMLFLDKLA